MRVLCTSDWHLGRTLEGRDRLDEQAAFIDELCAICDDEAVDLVLVAGDVFDTYNPPALAEQLFYDGLTRLADGGRRGVVVIAGNHDAPDRLAAASPLASSHGVTLVGTPAAPLWPDDPVLRASRPMSAWRVAAGAGWLSLQLPQVPHPVVVAAVPYPSEARLREALPLADSERGMQQAYSRRVGRLLSELSAHFRSDAVNLVTTHLYVSSGLTTESERPIELGGACSVDATVFPESAHFVALGHLHRPQEVRASAPCRYTGSPLAYSFSEVGAKSVCIVDAQPGRKALVDLIELSAGRPLVRWVATGGLVEVHSWLDAGLDSQAWIDLEVHAADFLTPQDICTLREASPRIVNIRAVVEGVEPLSRPSLQGLPLEELFRLFHRNVVRTEPDPELTRLFLELALGGGSTDFRDAVAWQGGAAEAAAEVAAMGEAVG